MAKFNKSGMTQAGINLMSKAMDGATIQFTKIVLGDGVMTGEIVDLQDMVSPKQNIDVNRVDRNGSQCTVGGELTTSSVTQGFFWRECGLYAMDPDLGEILYNYAYSTNPDYIAGNDSGTMEEILVSMIVSVGSNTNVEIVIDDSMVFATKKVVDKKPYYYKNVQKMKNDTSLKHGDMVITLGYYEPNDGGGAEYEVIDSGEEDKGSIHNLQKGLKAKLIVRNSTIDVRQFGVKNDTDIDVTTQINKCISYLSSIGGGTVILESNTTYEIKAHNELKPTGLITNGGITLKDNVYLNLNGATLKAITNNCEGYTVINITEVSNCKVYNGKIIGDIETHTGSSGEWGYGISLNGASNVLIEDMVTEKTWGDGINIQVLRREDEIIPCKNITIQRVKSDYNRRQGMSIESVVGCYVYNSSFTNTGKIKGTLPKAGIDIEPWADENPCKNIVIQNCIFEENEGTGLTCMGNEITDVLIDGCKFIKNVADNGQVFVNSSKDTIVSNCMFYNKENVSNIVWRTNKNVLVKNNKFDGTVLIYFIKKANEVIVDGNVFKPIKDIQYNSLIECVTHGETLVKPSIFRVTNNIFDANGKSVYAGVQTLSNAIIQNNLFRHLDYGVMSKYDTTISDNRFIACKLTAIGQNSGRCYVYSNTFDGCCCGNVGGSIVFNHAKKDLHIVNNTVFKDVLCDEDIIPEKRNTFSSLKTYEVEGIYTEYNNKIIENSRG